MCECVCSFLISFLWQHFIYGNIITIHLPSFYFSFLLLQFFNPLLNSFCTQFCNLHSIFNVLNYYFELLYQNVHNYSPVVEDLVSKFFVLVNTEINIFAESAFFLLLS